jgi:hypothetical protein
VFSDVGIEGVPNRIMFLKVAVMDMPELYRIVTSNNWHCVYISSYNDADNVTSMTVGNGDVDVCAVEW